MALPIVVNTGRALMTLPRATGPVQRATITALEARTGLKGLQTASAASRVRAWMGANPAKAAIVATALAEGGQQFFFGDSIGEQLLDGVSSFFSSDDYLATDGEGRLNAEFQAALARGREQMDRKVGDGNPETVDGAALSDVERHTEYLHYQFALIRSGIRVCGSLDEFLRLQEAILQVEPLSVAAYRRLRS